MGTTLTRTSSASAVLAVALLSSLAAGQTTYVNDPLTDPSSAGLGVQGGSFSASGWTTTSATDTLWWQISDALPSGSISFSVIGLGLGVSMTDSDQDLFSMYQEPTDASEPIPYGPFRTNDMKVFARIFGSAAGSVAGAIKLSLDSCMVGPPYHDNTCPADCTANSGIAYANGQAQDIGWDPAHQYQFIFSWGSGVMSYSRDGQVLGTVSYTGDYAPQPLAIHLGSPRGGQVAGASMPVGITFSNLLITGTAGTMTPVCDAPVPPPDAGPAVIAPCNDGAIGATADATAASWTSGSYGVGDLNVEADGSGNPDAIVFLDFPALQGPVAQATLSLHTTTDSHAAGDSGQVCLASGSWDPTTLTWANQPTVGTACAGPDRYVSPDQEVQWDVTALLQDGVAPSFAIVTSGSDGSHYFSTYSGGCAQGPRLYVQLGTPTEDAGSAPPDAGTAPADAGVAVVDAGTAPPDAGVAAVDAGTAPPDAGVTAADAGPARPDAGASAGDAGARGSDDAGLVLGGGPAVGDAGDTTHAPAGSCGCGSGGPASPLLLLLLLVLLAFRRRSAATSSTQEAESPT